MKKYDPKPATRRQFIKLAAAGLATTALPAVVSANSDANREQITGKSGKPDKKTVFNLGIASYTFRKFSLEESLRMTNLLAIDRIALKSFHLPLDSTEQQIKQVAKKVKEAGIKLYGAGVIYMKSEAEVHTAFTYAKTAGIEVIIGVPDHQFLDLVNKKVKESNIKVAIHNHGPGDKNYPSPASIMEKIATLDKRIGICMDVGHVQRYGLDPVQEINRVGNRLLDIHLKDVNGSDEEGKTVEIGRGIIDIPGILQALRVSGYSGILSFEFEKDEENPLPGLAESVGYTRGVLDML